MSPELAVKCRIDSVLLRYGIYDLRGKQVDAMRQGLADAVNEFMEQEPTAKQFLTLELNLLNTLAAAAWTASTNVKHLIKSAKESP